MATSARVTQRVIVLRRATPGSSAGSNGIGAEYTVAPGEIVPYNREPIDAPDGASPCVRRHLDHLVTTKKTGVGRSARSRTGRARGTEAVTPRQRGHSLAPEHVGEAGSVALLTLAILGLALFIAAVAMIVFGISTAARYGSLPPPNAGGLGAGQVIGGVGLAVLGLAVLFSALAVLADIRGSRPVAIAIAALSAILSAAGVLRVMTLGVGDPVLAGALAIVAILFAAAAIVLARPRR